MDLKEQSKQYEAAVDLYHRLFTEPDAPVSDIAEKLVNCRKSDLIDYFEYLYSLDLNFLLATEFGHDFYFNMSCLIYSVPFDDADSDIDHLLNLIDNLVKQSRTFTIVDTLPEPYQEKIKEFMNYYDTLRIQTDYEEDQISSSHGLHKEKRLTIEHGRMRKKISLQRNY
ncbi:MAG: hypothetical protein ACLFUO_02525 [Candidatus Woesearchaeota archaeon]